MVEIKNIKENNVVYTKNGVLQWKPIERHRKKKQYPMMDMGKISVPDDYCVDQTVLERSRELYKQTKEMIPVCITFDKRLIGGFEQWELAKELGHTRIPVYQHTMSNADRNQLREMVHTHSIGDKKFPVRDITGQKIYFSEGRAKKIKATQQAAMRKGYKACLLPDGSFSLMDGEDRFIVGSRRHGTELNCIRNYLNRKNQKGRDNH